MARLHRYAYDLPDIQFKPGWDPKTDPQEIAFQKLVEASANLPEGEVVGALMKWPVADSYAWYLVTSDKPLTLQYVPYCDGWTVPDALIRGVRKADVLDQLDRRRRLAAFYAERQSS